MARRGYPSDLRRYALAQLAAGNSVSQICRELNVSDQTIYNWRRKDVLDRQRVAAAGVPSPDLSAAHHRIRELERELAAVRETVDTLRDNASR